MLRPGEDLRWMREIRLGAPVRLDADQARRFRLVLARLHARDAAACRLPPVDRGPTRGLWTATVRAVRAGRPLPDLRELPSNAAWAAYALDALLGHAWTASQADAWLVRNLAVATAPPPPRDRALPIAGCRSWEDVRNRVIVEAERAPVPLLERWSARLDPYGSGGVSRSAYGSTIVG